MSVVWPEGRRFAFTVFDDTDGASVETVGAVYRLLGELGLRTTKSVWPLRAKSAGVGPGATLQDQAYREWLLGLQGQGFELALHNATWDTSTRAQTLRAFERFREVFGRPPRSLANHAQNDEAIYWGDARVSGWKRLAYRLLSRGRSGRFRGHVEGDPLFWGDICRAEGLYVRNFVLGDIDTLGACPVLPYHDPQRPFVPWWFAAAEGGDAAAFVRLLAPRNVQQLEEQGGASIVYAHLARGFVTGGRVAPGIEEALRRIAGRPGWFVPVEQLLDYLREQGLGGTIGPRERSRLEWAWIRHKLRVGGT